MRLPTRTRVPGSCGCDASGARRSPRCTPSTSTTAAGRRHRLVLRRFVGPIAGGGARPRRAGGRGADPPPRSWHRRAGARRGRRRRFRGAVMPAVLATRIAGSDRPPAGRPRTGGCASSPTRSGRSTRSTAVGLPRYVRYDDGAGQRSAAVVPTPRPCGSGRPRSSTAGPRPDRVTLIHRDYHPLNTLWSRGRITGIVDWASGCAGDPGRRHRPLSGQPRDAPRP